MALARKRIYMYSDCLYYKNVGQKTLPHNSVVVVGNRIGITLREAAVGQVVVCCFTGVWEMPVSKDFVYAAGDLLGWDVYDNEFNEDLDSNGIHAVVVSDEEGNLCPVEGYQWMLLG